MDDLIALADLIKIRNLLERRITALIHRPASIGHLGEYIASRIFDVELKEAAAYKSIDGHFRDGPLKDHTVNIKWYAMWEGLLDLTPDALPDYYLLLTGPRSAALSSRGQVRPWLVEHVFLFEAQPLVEALQQAGVKMGIATSVRRALWTAAEIYPTQTNTRLPLTDEQRAALKLFSAKAALGG